MWLKAPSSVWKIMYINSKKGTGHAKRRQLQFVSV